MYFCKEFYEFGNGIFNLVEPPFLVSTAILPPLSWCCQKKIYIISLMDNLYKIKKGLDLNLQGVAAQEVSVVAPSNVYALMPADFHGITPKMVVKEGEEVQVGSALFVDKATEQIKFCSPISGKVKAVVRGERRRILRVEVESDGKMQRVQLVKAGFQPATREEALQLLLNSGLFAFFRQRPYDVVACPTDMPKAVFISTFSKMPLAADFSFIVKGQEADFKSGIALLEKLAKVYVGISPEQINTPILPLDSAQVSVFSGPNPAGNVGVHINRVSPVNKGEIVWTVGPEVVVMMGRLLRQGMVDFTRRIAVAGSEVENPAYLDTVIGAPLKDVLAGKLKKSTSNQRIINGNPLVGEKTDLEGYLSAMVTEVCVLPEGDDVNELFGWAMPRLDQFSTNRSYFSWLLGSKKSYAPDCRIKGGERHMIMSGEYDRVFPMDIYAGYLVKAIITGDIDRQEQLGIYEVAPEDFAVAEFVDSSKLELQRIVREGLDILRKENA